MKCLTEKPLTDFYISPKGIINSRCRPCQSSWSHEYWTKNSKHLIEKTRVQGQNKRIKSKIIIEEYKKQPCADCGRSYPPHVMDFDHLPGEEKVNTVSYLAGHGYAIKTVEAEIAKCEVVCSNCHRERTYIRQWGSTEISIAERFGETQPIPTMRELTSRGMRD